MHTALRPFALAATLWAVASSASAVTTIYTTSASFLAQVAPGSYTNTFTGAVDAALSYSYSGGSFAYTVTAPPAGFGDDVYLSGTFIGNLYANASLTVTFTSGNVRAIGGNFYITNSSDAFVAAPITINLSDGTTTTFSPGTAADYRGFVSTVSITSLVMLAPGASRYNTIDNLTVGTPVPEPGSYALMALGLAAVLAARRKRSATAA